MYQTNRGALIWRTKEQPHRISPQSQGPSDSSIFTFPSCLRGYKAIMQNKPNSQNPRITTTPFTPTTYANIPPRAIQKNKPKQTQFIAAQPMAKPDPGAIRDTQYAIRDTKSIPCPLPTNP